ncbi:MAG: hypothetical protein JAY90_10715 [Candidatus Thiodiazotropha lotti]|nr:hypothetical protein [Candidatus Thiodiazotropha lotti]
MPNTTQLENSLKFVIEPQYIYAITANVRESGSDDGVSELYGTVCVNKTADSQSDEFISYPVCLFTIHCLGQTFTGMEGVLKFQQHAPGEYHNEGYGFRSSDGSFSFGNSDILTTNDMTFPDPPDFIDYASGGHGTLNGTSININNVKLIRIQCNLC